MIAARCERTVSRPIITRTTVTTSGPSTEQTCRRPSRRERTSPAGFSEASSANAAAAGTCAHPG
ncbi:hypothetical protein AQI88_17790 [Streptomyces cellostaticus]|uniref:Uncharacterized protein n=1 Tax=Streptomyces cellostaticus TaxID=67285 RepID=A0A124HCR7_9ACTN|nr:hypothetical protein AQI88_17790 [Streptomyces cellostaticus]